MDDRQLKTELDPYGEEFGNVARDFFCTLDSVEILHIYSIHHPACWSKFKNKVKSKLKQSSGQINESCGVIRSLFHGTSSTSPDTILSDSIGFNIEYANNRGLWGKGLYFAVNSSYSDIYSHIEDKGEKERSMFLAKVFIGNSYQTKQDNSITRPPSNFHSMTGETGGSHVFILYENSLAYPSFLIVYRNC